MKKESIYDKVQPVILGSDENAYGCARQFSEFCQVKPALLCSLRFYCTRESRILDLIKIDGFDSEDVFPGALEDFLKKKKSAGLIPVVVPCSDGYARLLSKYACRFEGLAANSFPGFRLFETFETKDRFYRLCDEHGLDYPKTAVVPPDSSGDYPSDIPMELPIVVKPENSNGYEYCHADFEGKKKVYFINSESGYKDLILKLSGSGYRGKLIVQEFVPGGDDAMRVINCYSGENGQVRFMSLGQPVLEEYSPATIGNYATIISRSDAGICERIRIFLNDIGYIGFSNFDMKYDAARGRYVLFEINPRPGRSSFYVRAAGHNLMKELCDDVILHEKRENPVISQKEAVWTEIPMSTVMKYVRDDELRREIKSIRRKGGVKTTVLNRKDKSPKRTYAVIRHCLAIARSYGRYWFDKNAGAGT